MSAAHIVIVVKRSLALQRTYIAVNHGLIRALSDSVNSKTANLTVKRSLHVR